MIVMLVTEQEVEVVVVLIFLAASFAQPLPYSTVRGSFSTIELFQKTMTTRVLTD